MSTEVHDTSQASKADEESVTIENVPHDEGTADAILTAEGEGEGEGKGKGEGEGEGKDESKVKDEGDVAVTVAAEGLPSKPKPMLCGICEEENGKYKCPRCSLP